ncbi:MAG: zinc ribbon domain-containing protein [Clostridia bacterium]|nr:zinc ribbon domain-containing protein [Clostridia bacterium]
MICPNCKTVNSDSARFCEKCGAEFLPETQKPQSSPVTYAPPSGNTPSMMSGSPVPTKVQQNGNNNVTINKTTLIIIIAVVALLIVGLGVFAIVAMQGGNSSTDFFNQEIITDAEGEKIKEGRGTTEMAVIDTDGTVRTIKTDRSLLTPDKILEEYTLVMNKLKNDAPGFSFTRYQNLPTDYQNVGAAATIVLPIIEKYVTSKTASETLAYPAGNSDKLPLPYSSYGCLLTDTAKIRNAYCEVLEKDVYKIVITLTDELNPQINPAGATTSTSAITAMFDPYDAATQITAISELAFNKIDFNYTGCTATLIYDCDTDKVQSINMTMNIDITANTLIGKLQARIVDICEYTDITY